MDSPKVTVMILNYNTSSDVEKCLSFISKQGYDNFSIIIVDNASAKEEERERLLHISEL